MNARERSNLALGLVLVLVGLFFLANQFAPGFGGWLRITYSWPLIVIGAGVIVLFIGLLGGNPESAVAAFIVAGVGGILYWQNLTGRWDTWAYAWTLIPGFAGLGTMVAGLIGPDTRHKLDQGFRQVFISLVLFVAFGSIFGGLSFLGPYWPLLLVALGLYLLFRAILGRR